MKFVKMFLFVIFISPAAWSETQLLNDLHYMKLLSNQGEINLHLYNHSPTRGEYLLKIQNITSEIESTRMAIIGKVGMEPNRKLEAQVSEYTANLSRLGRRIEDRELVRESELRKLNEIHNNLNDTLASLYLEFSSSPEAEQAKVARKGSDALLELNRRYVYTAIGTTGHESEGSAEALTTLVSEYNQVFTTLENDAHIDKESIRELKKNWRFIEPSISGHRSISTPLVVNRFSTEMIDELVGISRQFE